MTIATGVDFLFGAIGIAGGGLLAFNVWHARDRYTAFLSGADIPRAWHRSRANEPRMARAYGFLFFVFGVVLVAVGVNSVLGIR
jgi:hypothetical protein